TFDLTGLPPTREELAEYLADESPEAQKRVVDRLLASPHYGERWARHWLDLVRFSETNGHEYDNDKMAPWRYRDYVIRAFNQDLPYDQFVREHIAGDLLAKPRLSPDGTITESPIGTAFYWFGEVLNSATDSVKSRADEVDNQIDVLGKAFQGLTIACARCHDHKFDPIPTRDYYALAGVLHSTDMREADVDSPARRAEIRAISSKLMHPAPLPRAVVHHRAEDQVHHRFADGFGEWRTAGEAFGSGPVGAAASSLAAGSPSFVGTLTSPKVRLGEKQYLHVRLAGRGGDAKLKERGLVRFTSVCDGYKGQHIAPESTTPYWKTLTLIFERNRVCYYELVDLSPDGYLEVYEMVFSDSKTPPPTDRAEAKSPELPRAEVPTSAFTMVASDYQPHNVKVHLRGSHLQLGDEVPRGFLKIAGWNGNVSDGSGRLQVAETIASSSNPLTARVMVNRIWRHHFGKGLVRSTDNFGATGDAPTHPELLDYLATRFVESGWSVKSMHRTLVLSSTYSMSSAPSDLSKSQDPDNKFLQHMPVRRLEGEAIRDALLAVSGKLDKTMYGPSVPPHISSYQEGRGKPASGPLDGNGRRSLYIQVRRNFLTPMFLAFDYPLPISTIGARSTSTVPSQALLMMNNELVMKTARDWATESRKNADDPRTRLSHMYEQAFGRMPDNLESEELLAFASKQAERYRALEDPPADPEEAAWTDVAHVLFNSPEFVYLK
ncbi:MAG TPA: DUF1549 and DUF1553 domain-containing protein, partial [Bryobacteraceae bacterium]|nr:DUF1549 and DUF1553 domain-containing protein [Bryobacteraceae bacterium]